MIEIMIVKEPSIMREGLEFIITGNFVNAIVESYTIKELNALILKTHTPDLVIIELTKDSHDILPIIRYYTKQKIKVAILLSQFNKEIVQKFLLLNVSGYLYEWMNPSEFVAAIRALLNDYDYMYPTFLKELLSIGIEKY